MEGNVTEFSRVTGWSGSEVLYFGDHVYSDLADPAIRSGWRTGAVIRELTREVPTSDRSCLTPRQVEIMNTLEYQKALTWSLTLQDFIAEYQVVPTTGGSLTCNRPASTLPSIQPS